MLLPHVMTDLETIGTRAGCTILSIGAVCFSHTGLGAEFYTVISRQSCKLSGLYEDRGTLAWWSRQSEQAREVLTDDKAIPLTDALEGFSQFVFANTTPGRRMWGNGADFDLPILGHVYSITGKRQPWRYVESRCFRTLKAVFQHIPPPVREGTHHNALDDARHQATHAAMIMRSVLK